MEVKITIASKHSREGAFGGIIKNVHRFAETLGIGKLIAHTQRRASTLSHHHIAFTQPSSILLIDCDISLALLMQTQIGTSHMLGENLVIAFHVINHAVI